MNTYEIIKELAKEKKISIRQLELNFGYSNGYLASWKRQNPNPVELSRLADYFNVSVDYLLGREEKTIFINNKLLEKNSDFEISHELGHCIKKHDKLTDYYNINEYSRNKLEYEANQIAIQILLTIWINEYDLQKEQLNAVKFMEYYQIPSRLEFCVKETMLNYQ